VIPHRVTFRSDLNTAVWPHDQVLIFLIDKFDMQELWSVHAESGTQSALDFEVCATCRQILSASDLSCHVSSHTLENHFPALGSSEVMSQAWGKK
jgi:hypothetical protein